MINNSYNILFEKFLEIEPYILDQKTRENLFFEIMKVLTEHHLNNSKQYQNILNASSFRMDKLIKISDLPFLPVRLFKEENLLSIKDENIIKTMTSSGTSGQQVSKIYLDKTTARNQTKVLNKIVSSFIGKTRLPMLILDSSSVIKDRSMFSARGAGILGFSIFGKEKLYVFDENMKIRVDELNNFMQIHRDKNIFMFGFTFMIWKHFYKELKIVDYKPNLSKAILIHGGGWKKLVTESVSTDIFKSELNKVCKIKKSNIHDYYGMVEQTGSLYMECEYGYLHTSIFSDIIIRNSKDFSVCSEGQNGIIQVLSILPHSYPGHSLLTEDEGILIGQDGCKCGRRGKYFKVLGRIKSAELRGCSNTYEG